MGRVGQSQVALGPTQPPFPGGWVIALLSAAGEGFSEKRRTVSRMKAGASVEHETYQEWERKLTAAVKRAFPRVSAINGFAGKYVDEYFRLWRVSAEHAPRWASFAGNTPAARQVLARALVRDLLLRLGYLESCERRLAGRTETVLMRPGSIHGFYSLLIKQRVFSEGSTQEALSGNLGVDPAVLRRWKRGDGVPSWSQLRKLALAGDVRLLAGVRFLDLLLRRLNLRGDPLAEEGLGAVAIFMREHSTALEEFRGEVPLKPGASAGRAVGFEEFARFGDHLLLFPGWERVHDSMPDALWRAHVRALRFGGFFDLAQNYLHYGTGEDEEPLRRALAAAGRQNDLL